ncbi:unnamed protein product [Pedinophyceae sp. YPF-701]|nr:unnamed protein product [Pedinophyceae sp. YPF-701]
MPSSGAAFSAGALRGARPPSCPCHRARRPRGAPPAHSARLGPVCAAFWGSKDGDVFGTGARQGAGPRDAWDAAGDGLQMMEIDPATGRPRRGARGGMPPGAAAAVEAAQVAGRVASEPGEGPGERVRLFKGLTGDDFRHPLDQQNTQLLRSLPGLEAIAKNIMGPVAEQVLLLENISTSVKVGPDQLPSVWNSMQEAATMLGMDAPDLYIRQNPVPNAYTLAIAGRKPFVVVHTSLIEILSERELQAVLAHELGHLKCDHGVWLTLANFLAMSTASVIPMVGATLEDNLLRWLRAAELTCDRAALLVAQDSRVVVSALMKLAGGTAKFATELNVEAFLEQARSYDEATSSPLGWYLRNAQTRQLSHPLPVMRAREIDRWFESQEYRDILRKGL